MIVKFHKGQLKCNGVMFKIKKISENTDCTQPPYHKEIILDVKDIKYISRTT